MPDYVEIKIKEHLDRTWSTKLSGLKLSYPENGGTLLTGSLPDQTALHGVLECIRDLNLTLVSVTRAGESTKENRRIKMKTVVISYSYTGNNEDLASSFAKEIGADHICVTETKARTMGTIIMDALFNRNPKISMSKDAVLEDKFVILFAPVWLGQVAAPMRPVMKQLKGKSIKYGFISLTGGADGPGCNDKVPSELKKRMGREAEFVLDLYKADLLLEDVEPTRQLTMDLRVNEAQVKSLLASIKASLANEPMMQGQF